MSDEALPSAAGRVNYIVMWLCCRRRDILSTPRDADRVGATLAQLVERRFRKAQVAGSSPAGGFLTHSRIEKSKGETDTPNVSVSSFDVSNFPQYTSRVATTLQPFYQNVQAHYDLSDEFFGLFLDPSRTYSCAYFEHEGMTLEQAQAAKIDLALGKCNLKSGMKLLDIGCGWGATAMRAATKHNVDVIGLTLSRNQYQYAKKLTLTIPKSVGRVEFRLQAWEEFDEPVDRIVSIGAFEHFRKSRYAAFFEKCRRLLPNEGGRMLLHTIVMADPKVLAEKGLAVEHEHVLFAKFIGEVIFPGGQLCFPTLIVKHAEEAGFKVERIHALGPHYARTLDCWAANLKAKREQAIALTSLQVFDDYMKYFTGCANYFRSGHIDVMQFTLASK